MNRLVSLAKEIEFATTLPYTVPVTLSELGAGARISVSWLNDLKLAYPAYRR